MGESGASLKRPRREFLRLSLLRDPAERAELKIVEGRQGRVGNGAGDEARVPLAQALANRFKERVLRAGCFGCGCIGGRDPNPSTPGHVLRQQTAEASHRGQHRSPGVCRALSLVLQGCGRAENSPAENGNPLGRAGFRAYWRWKPG
jgi:hypothetical protein